MRVLSSFSIVLAAAVLGGSATSALANDTLTPLADSANTLPVITVAKAADAVGASVDIVAGTLARRAAEDAAKGDGKGGPVISLSGMAPWGSPVSASRVSSRFGLRGDPMGAGRRMHSGTDLAAPMGSPIFATSDGVVSAARWNGGYGLYVSLDHSAALQTRYGHLSRIAVAPGQRVRRGQLIGFVGSTGRSTGPHLHYEVRRNGVATDPAASGLYTAPGSKSVGRDRRR